MINNVTLTGRLTRDPELRYTAEKGRAVTRFTLAVNRDFVNGDGVREADFLNVVAWGKLAETCANYLAKGSLIGIIGRLQSRSYENKDGQTVYVTEVKMEKLTFLEPKKSKLNDQANNQEKKETSKYYNPYQDPYDDPFAANETINIPDEDFPF